MSGEEGGDVEFAAWPTLVADEDVELSSVQFDAGKRSLVAVLELPGDGGRLVFGFADVEAFRVLDEGGLTQLWAATAASGRPARTTFMVRGHKWTRESEISFHIGTTEGWSYVIATGDDCLEVLTRTAPSLARA